MLSAILRDRRDRMRLFIRVSILMLRLPVMRLSLLISMDLRHLKRSTPQLSIWSMMATEVLTTNGPPTSQAQRWAHMVVVTCPINRLRPAILQARGQVLLALAA